MKATLEQKEKSVTHCCRTRCVVVQALVEVGVTVAVGEVVGVGWGGLYTCSVFAGGALVEYQDADTFANTR